MDDAKLERAPIDADPWESLRRFTSARIALGRAGGSLHTAPLLQFQLAHARARDAVQQDLDVDALCTTLATHAIEPLRLHSAAPNRRTYVQRPDLGRILHAASKAALQALAQPHAPFDAVFVLADGLSALALERHALPLLQLLLPKLLGAGWRLAPACVVTQARVAVGDEIGALLPARLAVVLIGERPGLSSPDSLGAYLTWDPLPGRSNAQRNCISNIRPEGLTYAVAAHKLCHLMLEARRRRLTGVDLKEDAPALPPVSDVRPLSGS
jgi:ethanolamine ammonia-lyase small subunit